MTGACALLAASALHPAEAAGRSAEQSPRLQIETDVSLTANLVHWVDNLAGSSVGKTKPVYRLYWEQRFGPVDEADRQALQAFARARMAGTVPGVRVANESGCLPHEAEALSWHQVFLVEAMRAHSVGDLTRSLAPYLSQADLAGLSAALDHFQPRFHRVWKDLEHVRRFERRFRSFVEQGEMADYLIDLAGFFGVDPGSAPPMRISLMGLPSDGPTHAEADGDYLLIEIRPADTPRDQVQVVAHEASHFLMRRMGVDRIDRLARQAYEGGDAGALVWRYMWEGIPTALGQGLAEARLSPRTFSMSQSWYHIGVVDRFAKLIYPLAAREVSRAGTIEGGMLADISKTLVGSSIYTEARAAEFLVTAFFASGDQLAAPLSELRDRLRIGRGESSPSFAVADPRGSDLLRRYPCLGGAVMVSAAELEAAATLGGETLLAPRVVRRATEQAANGTAVIAAGRRKAGGPVFFLVAPRSGRVGPLLEAFARLRGVPSAPIAVPSGS